jgi:hypothetical protein
MRFVFRNAGRQHLHNQRCLRALDGRRPNVRPDSRKICKSGNANLFGLVRKNSIPACRVVEETKLEGIFYVLIGISNQFINRTDCIH